MHTTTAGGAAHAQRDAGLSLVEVMVAMALFVVGSLSLLSVLVSTTNGSVDNRARVTAANLAASDIDLMRSEPYENVTSTLPSPTPTVVGGQAYTVERKVVLTEATGSATSACVSSGGTRPLYKRVSTTVRTKFRGSAQAVRADTLIKAPVYNPTDPLTKGAIGFLVMDRDSKPLAALQVTAAAQTTPTDSNGCAFFDGLAAGDHTVTVARANSVTRAGRTPMSKTVRVTAGRITSDSLRIDTIVPVKVSVDVKVGGTTTTTASAATMPTNLKAYLATPDRATASKLVLDHAPTLTSAPQLVSWNAFPAPGGYEAYLGRCAPAVFRTDAEPGTTPTQGAFHLTPVQIDMNGDQADSPRASGKTVTVTSRVPNCDETLTYNAVTPNGCSPNSSGSTQCRFDIVVPPGDWTFTVATPGAPPVESVYSRAYLVPTDPNTKPTVTISVS